MELDNSAAAEAATDKLESSPIESSDSEADDTEVHDAFGQMPSLEEQQEVDATHPDLGSLDEVSPEAALLADAVEAEANAYGNQDSDVNLLDRDGVHEFDGHDESEEDEDDDIDFVNFAKALHAKQIAEDRQHDDSDFLSDAFERHIDLDKTLENDDFQGIESSKHPEEDDEPVVISDVRLPSSEDIAASTGEQFYDIEDGHKILDRLEKQNVDAADAADGATDADSETNEKPVTASWGDAAPDKSIADDFDVDDATIDAEIDAIDAVSTTPAAERLAKEEAARAREALKHDDLGKPATDEPASDSELLKDADESDLDEILGSHEFRGFPDKGYPDIDEDHTNGHSNIVMLDADEAAGPQPSAYESDLDEAVNNLDIANLKEPDTPSHLLDDDDSAPMPEPAVSMPKTETEAEAEAVAEAKVGAEADQEPMPEAAFDVEAEAATEPVSQSQSESERAERAQMAAAEDDADYAAPADSELDAEVEPEHQADADSDASAENEAAEPELEAEIEGVDDSAAAAAAAEDAEDAEATESLLDRQASRAIDDIINNEDLRGVSSYENNDDEKKIEENDMIIPEPVVAQGMAAPAFDHDVEKALDQFNVENLVEATDAESGTTASFSHDGSTDMPIGVDEDVNRELDDILSSTDMQGVSSYSNNDDETKIEENDMIMPEPALAHGNAYNSTYDEDLDSALDHFDDSFLKPEMEQALAETEVESEPVAESVQEVMPEVQPEVKTEVAPEAAPVADAAAVAEAEVAAEAEDEESAPSSDFSSNLEPNETGDEDAPSMWSVPQDDYDLHQVSGRSNSTEEAEHVVSEPTVAEPVVEVAEPTVVAEPIVEPVAELEPAPEPEPEVAVEHNMASFVEDSGAHAEAGNDDSGADLNAAGFTTSLDDFADVLGTADTADTDATEAEPASADRASADRASGDDSFSKEAEVFAVDNDAFGVDDVAPESVAAPSEAQEPISDADAAKAAAMGMDLGAEDADSDSAESSLDDANVGFAEEDLNGVDISNMPPPNFNLPTDIEQPIDSSGFSQQDILSMIASEDATAPVADEAVAEPEAQAQAESVVEPSAATEVDSEVAPTLSAAAVEPEVVAEPEPTVEEAVAEPELVPEADPAFEAEPSVTAEVEPAVEEAVAEPASVPEAEPAAEAEPVMAEEPVVEATPEVETFADDDAEAEPEVKVEAVEPEQTLAADDAFADAELPDTAADDDVFAPADADAASNAFGDVKLPEASADEAFGAADSDVFADTKMPEAADVAGADDAFAGAGAGAGAGADSDAFGDAGDFDMAAAGFSTQGFDDEPSTEGSDFGEIDPDALANADETETEAEPSDAFVNEEEEKFVNGMMNGEQKPDLDIDKEKAMAENDQIVNNMIAEENSADDFAKHFSHDDFADAFDEGSGAKATRAADADFDSAETLEHVSEPEPDFSAPAELVAETAAAEPEEAPANSEVNYKALLSQSRIHFELGEFEDGERCAQEIIHNAKDQALVDEAKEMLDIYREVYGQ